MNEIVKFCFFWKLYEPKAPRQRLAIFKHIVQQSALLTVLTYVVTSLQSLNQTFLNLNRLLIDCTLGLGEKPQEHEVSSRFSHSDVQQREPTVRCTTTGAHSGAMYNYGSPQCDEL